ncbi:hypothetical protein DA2_3773 [Desulfovibrio sp. A2]|nr:hypothetical protein DA2_3773 [Desulfovibrio sp. A2]
MATLNPSSAHLTARERIWASIRAQTEPWTLATIALTAKAERSQVKDYVTGLRAAGIVAAHTPSPRPGVAATYRLAVDRGVDAPRVRTDGSEVPPSGRARMWRAMKMLRQFSVAELAAQASLPDAPVALGEADHYCHWLARGGYLLAAGTDRWVFVPGRDTGPKAPQVLRVKRLLDPNNGVIVYESAPEGGDE